MRLSEQLRAQVGDYTSNTGMLMIRRKKVRRAPATHYVPLTPIAVEASNQLVAGKKTSDPLCANTDDAVLYEARYWFVLAVDEAGVVDLMWHCLRHTVASRWVMNGVPRGCFALPWTLLDQSSHNVQSSLTRQHSKSDCGQMSD